MLWGWRSQTLSLPFLLIVTFLLGRGRLLLGSLLLEAVEAGLVVGGTVTPEGTLGTTAHVHPVG